MRRSGIGATILAVMAAMVLPCSVVQAATDGFYQLSEVTVAWDGTDASRTKAQSVDYDYTYGDEASITYSLPWPVNFYGQLYSQITADTNGNVWFTASGSAHSFNLASNGRGPVIAAWNNDLSSYFYGGVFVQHKTNPERVVIEWQAETYTEEGYSLPNAFEVILFPNGTVRVDYKAFNSSVAKDFGSGISNGDGIHYIASTTDYGNVFTLVGRSLSFVPYYTLSVNFTGTGSGTVTSTPAGIACNTSCSSQFLAGTAVTLSAEAAPESSFNRWSNGQCSGTGACQTTIGANAAVTATFDIQPPTADFTATPTFGYAPSPLLATFTSQAQRATSWSWEFGDGTTSAEQSPVHTYQDVGSYTVTLTATNSSGSTVSSKANYVVVAVCPNPVRNVRLGTLYSSLSAAYAQAQDGDTLQLVETTFLEGLDSTKTIVLDGSYLCDFSAKTGGLSVLKGAQTNVLGGTLTVKDIFIDK